MFSLFTNRRRCNIYWCSNRFQYRQYTVKDFSSGKFLNFRLCDTRGFEEELALDAEEISFALDGHVPDRYQVCFNQTFNASINIVHIYESFGWKVDITNSDQ